MNFFNELFDITSVQNDVLYTICINNKIKNQYSIKKYINSLNDYNTS